MKKLLVLSVMAIFFLSGCVSFDQPWRCDKPNQIYDSTVGECVPDMEGTSLPEPAPERDIPDRECEPSGPNHSDT